MTNDILIGKPKKRGPKQEGQKEIEDQLLADQLVEMGRDARIQMSPRGWCYYFEGKGYITKERFTSVGADISRLRQEGYLPFNFVADEEGRQFDNVTGFEGSIGSGIKSPDYMLLDINNKLANIFDIEYGFAPAPGYWEDEKYYVQMLVEKIDLVSLFAPICARYNIPIATTKGQPSTMQRAYMSKRYREAELHGLKCVLLYCGDFDPHGFIISDGLKDNFKRLQKGYFLSNFEAREEIKFDVDALTIERFGLNYDFIVENKLSWINNLETSSGENLSDPKHKFYNSRQVQEYIKKYGIRKCEANALVINPEAAHELCENAIKKYIDGQPERHNVRSRHASDDFYNISNYNKKIALEKIRLNGSNIYQSIEDAKKAINASLRAGDQA